MFISGNLNNDPRNYKAAAKRVNFLLVEQNEHKDIDLEREIEKYLAYACHKLKLVDSRFVPYKDAWLHDIVQRAAQRIRPCSRNGEEFRDALLWLTILDSATSDDKTPIIFLSSNKMEFAGPNGELHSTLRKEAEDKGVEVFYYDSIQGFLAAHADKLEYVTKEWITSLNAPHLVAEDVVVWVDAEYQQNLLEWAARREIALTGYLDTKSAEVSVKSFFVFRWDDDKFAVEVTYSGYATVEFEHEVELQGLSCFNPDYIHREKRLEDFLVGVKAIVELICDEQGFQDVHTVAVSVEP